MLSADTDPGRRPGVWPGEPDLDALPLVLLEPFRDAKLIPKFDVDYVCDRLDWKPTFAQARRLRLADHPRIRAELEDQGRVTFQDLAYAALRAYPHSDCPAGVSPEE